MKTRGKIIMESVRESNCFGFKSYAKYNILNRIELLKVFKEMNNVHL